MNLAAKEILAADFFTNWLLVLAQKDAEKFKSDLATCQQELEQSNLKLKNETENSRKEIEFLKNKLLSLEQIIENSKNETLLCQNETENSNNRTNAIEDLEQINLNLRNETQKCEQEVQELQLEIASSINRTSEGQESERQSNGTEIIMNDIEKLPIMTSDFVSIETSNSAMTSDVTSDNEASNNEVVLCQQEATKWKSDLENCQLQATSKCSSDQLRTGSLQSTGNVVISLIRQVENAREIDACLGMSTEFGYITFHQCCEADQVTLFDLETYEEIPIGNNSLWIEEHICFINTTEIEMNEFSQLRY